MERRQKLGWILAGAFALLLVVLAAGYEVVHTASFNRWLLGKIVEEAQTATGARIRINSMAVRWDALDIDFYGVKVSSSGGSGDRDLLDVSHVGIGLKILSLWRRKINLAKIAMDQPVVHFDIDAYGNSNLPHAQSAKSSGVTPGTVFDMAVGSVRIGSGEIFYNDQGIPLSAELYNFHSGIDFSRLSDSYSGAIGYDKGLIRTRGYSPIEHGVQLQFAANRSGIRFDSLVLTAGKSRMTLRGQLANYGSPQVQAEYQATVFSDDLELIIKTTSLPVGQVNLQGTLHYANMAANQPFINEVSVDGRLDSRQMLIRLARASTTANSIRGAFSSRGGNLRVQGIYAQLLHGALQGNFEMLNLAGNSSSRFDGTLRGISLRDLGDALPPGSYKRIHLLGSANADLQAAWPRSVADISAHARVTISNPSPTRIDPSQIPVQGMLDVTYEGARDTVSFGRSYLRTGNTDVLLAGTLSKKSNLAITVNAKDLHEVGELMSSVQAATSSEVASSSLTSTLDTLRGTAHFQGRVSGSPKAPDVRGELIANNLRVHKSQWKDVRTGIEIAANKIALQNAVLDDPRQERIALSGEVGLANWSYFSTSPISANITVANLSVDELQKIADVQYPVSGNLSGNLSVNGSEENPGGHGSLQITKASAWGEPLDRFDATFQGSDGAIRSTAHVQAPAGSVNAELTYSPKSQRYEAKVNAASLKLEKIRALQKSPGGVSGLLTLSASGHGSIENPQLSVNAQLPELQVHDQTISRTALQASLNGKQATFDLASTVAQGNVEAKGNVDLAGNYPSTVSLDVRAIPLGPLLASYVLGKVPDLQGETEIHATANGPLKEPSLMQVHLSVPKFNLTYKTAQIALAGPLTADCRNGVATIQPAEWKGSGTDVTIQGAVPIHNFSQATLAAKGSIDLSLLQGFTNGVKSSGRIDIDVSARGNTPGSNISGQMRVTNGALFTDSLPLGFENVNGEVRISGKRLEISELKATAGGGNLSAGGFLDYGPASNFNLNLSADSVRLRYPTGLRSVSRADLHFSGTPHDSNFTGRVIVERLSLTQQFDLADFMPQFGGESAPTASSAFEENAKLNISIQSGDELRLANSKLSMTGAANLNLTGTLANPVVLGRVSLTGGDVFFLGKRYQVQNGTIAFSNPVHTEPVLNLYAETTIEQYDIKINFVGPPDRLRTTYTSDPPLPPSDIINLLALGKTAEESAQDTTPASVSAESVLAQGVGGQVSGKIESLTGISQLTLNPMAGGNQQNPGAQVAIQQRVTGNLLLTFSTDVTSTQATTVQLQYQTSKQTSVSVLRDQNGGYAIDVRLHKKF